MKTIGSRLTLLYVVAVTGTLVGILLLGRFLLEKHLVNNVDANLQLKFVQLKERLHADIEPGDVQGLLATAQADGSYSMQVEDLWNDPAYRAARLNGTAAPESDQLEFFTETSPQGPTRTVRGVNQSIKIRISTPLRLVQEALDAYTRIGSGIIFAALLLSIAAGHFLSRVALRPVRLIERAALRISSDNLSERIPVKEVQDEISNLARLLNNTFDRLESSFEQIKRFSADASHELKTPLSLVRLNIERVVLNDTLSSPARETLQDAIEEIHHLNRLIENLLFISRAEAGEVELNRQPVAAPDFIASFLHDAQILAEAGGSALVVSCNEPGRVNVDAERIRQVLLNLLSNSIKFTPSGGRIELSSSFAADSWCVSLQDEGSGVPPDKLEAIFDRFVRIQPSSAWNQKLHSGTGLGLAISRTIVELHGGRISAHNRPDGHGLCIECAFPLSS